MKTVTQVVAMGLLLGASITLLLGVQHAASGKDCSTPFSTTTPANAAQKSCVDWGVIMGLGITGCFLLLLAKLVPS